MSPLFLAAVDVAKLTIADIVRCPTTWGLVLSAIGLWLILPRAVRHGKTIGGLLLIISLGLFGADLPWLANPAAQGVFWLVAVTTLVSAVGCITAQSPVYSALWFAMSLVGTSGLFFIDGAQFLAVATIVVYAGAIVVTFLFVLMLAQPEGHAPYDRISWGWFPRAISVFVAGCLVAMLTLALSGLKTQAVAEGKAMEARAVAAATAAKNNPEEKTVSAPLAQQPNDILNPNHMARLGGYLFTRHLISLEVAGTLLLAALVGAVAIAIQGKQRDRVEEALSPGANAR
ncbi:NADH-quinone oxidoreductase subunit J [Anatilimnocola aggregata]|uniref:NADH-quinone oxidoreductase subunit J n=1 Tax=Anatilimnocola aggregata TaxID=2528021 RepID=A0A517YA48_9BACT|nr:NADH-quinone oxidoreductase subunit J [Anatilimnocola aggregata]QDU27106.1 NADH-quinone oxidoreductase subunit J [Anatilimnocola aggregata]